MPAPHLSPEAIRRTVPKLRDELGRADRERLDILLPLFRSTAEVSLGAALVALYPDMAQEDALTAFRQFRKRLKDSAGEAEMDLQLEADTQTRSLPNQRLCWFEGVDGAVEAVTQLVEEETVDVRRTSQGAFELRDNKLVIRYFLSFSHDDESLKKDLLKRLENFLRSSTHYQFEIWQDGLILPGDAWHGQIQNAIEHCHFGLLLTSPAFLASPYIREHELPHFVSSDGEAVDEGRRAIPVAIKPLLFDGSLDLKGLQHRQVFRDSEGKAFSERSGNKKDSFAQQLFQRIVQVIGKRIVPALQDGIPLRRAFEQRLCDHLGRQMEECHFVPTEGFPSSLDKLDTEAREAGEEKIPRIDALNYLLEWAQDPNAPAYCALLGEYGMGKSTTCMALAQQLLQKRQQDKTFPLPIYLDLRHLGDKAQSGLSLTEIVDEVLRRSWRGGQIQVDLKAADVIRLVQQEGALIIFDGLDEVLVHLSPSAGQRFTRELLRALPPRKARSKSARAKSGRLLLSCRTHFFRTLRDQKNLLLGEDREPLAPEDYRAFVLMPFSEEQIRRYLQATLPGEDPNRLLELIRAVHNLTEMAERPYTLNLISRHIPQIEQWKMEGRQVTGVTLYRHMVLSWLERDEGKHQLTPEHKQRLMEYFAAELWRSGRRTWSVGDIEQWLIDLLRARPEIAAHYEGKDRDLLKEDLRTATFLVRVGEDQFRFAHTSLQEFFLACYLYRALLEQAPERWALPMASPETLDFLGQLLIENTAEQDAAMKALRALRDAYRPQASELAFAYALRARIKNHPAPPQTGVRLEGSNLRRWKMEGKPGQRFNLRGAVFRDTLLEEAVFRHADLEGADFSGAAMARAEFRDCRAPRSEFASAGLAGTLFRDTQLTAANFLGAHCHRTHWLACHLEETKGLPTESPAGFFALCSSPPASACLPPEKALMSLAVIAGHSSINDICFSPDGKLIASASSDHTLCLWDVDSGECLASLAGHEGSVNGVAFSPDGGRIASSSSDHTLRLWDTNSEACLATFAGHKNEVNDVAFSPDGRHIASTSSDHTLRLWDVESGACLATFAGHEDRVHALAFSPDGRRIASASSDQTLRLWNVESGACHTILVGHEEPVHALAYSPDGGRIASVSSDSTLRLWDANSGEFLVTLVMQEGVGSTVAFSPDGKCIATSSWDVLHLWDAESGEPIATLDVLGGLDICAAFSPVGRYIALAHWGSPPRLWDYGSREYLADFVGENNRFTAIAFSPDSRRIASGSSDGSPRVWDAESGQCFATLDGHAGRVAALAFSPDGERFVTAGMDRTLRLWDANNDTCLATLAGHESGVTALAFSPDGGRIASASWDKTLRLWDSASGACLVTFTIGDSWPNSISFSPDNGRIALSSLLENDFHLLDANSGEALATFSGHKGSVREVAFFPGGRRIASASSDDTLRLWDTNSGECLAIFTGHTGSVNALDISPDGGRIVSASSDHTLRLWDVESGACLAILEAHEGEANDVAFSPDGKYIAGCGPKGMFIYRTESLELVRQIFLFQNNTWINLDATCNKVDQVHGEAWRWLRWRGIDEATGKPETWPAEIFGPLPE